MKNLIKLLGIVAIVAAIGFAVVGCNKDSDTACSEDGNCGYVGEGLKLCNNSDCAVNKDSGRTCRC